ncbi:MAG: HD domain-containing protein [Proteobacteria bacterium]|nr:HD domain-containing protein [Pseudomonadota bacterium]
MNRLTEQMVKFAFEMDKSEIKRQFSIPQEIAHFTSTAQIAKIIAKKRGIDTRLATATALAHDIYRIKTGINENHAELGAPIAKEFLKNHSDLSDEEIEKVVLAVKNHSKKGEIGTPLEELIKDVDVFDSYFYNIKKESDPYRKRFYKLAKELGLSESDYEY